MSTGIIYLFDYKYGDFTLRLLNIHKDLVSNLIPDVSIRQIWILLFQLFLSLLFASFFGLLLFNIIKKAKLDIVFSFLQFDSKWKYIFRDEKKVFDSVPRNSYNEFDSSQIDVLVKDNSGDTYLYCGLLNSFSTDRNGDLESISLLHTRRFSKKKIGDKVETSVKPVPGHIMVLPYSNVLNMNITYFYRRKRSKSRVWDNVLVIINVIILFLILVFPWFSLVGLFYKLLSVVVLLLSWGCFVGFNMSFTQKTKGLIKWSTRFLFLLFTVLFFLTALWLLSF